ncbi:polyphosphate polymerase domain-containing protein [Vallitalea okinawensis]|uniref:polyphosphate polymerase domain-containing protein n=1 Tax=Vallitalea okinawensis TaxID=2078660 RepID=UPI000CFB755F|nr:polyphosphate polymerase domain-containing protein [Vallitalea okinawensis]
MKNTKVFNRWELKYIVHIKDQYKLINELNKYVVQDQNGTNGMYKIKSLYYDTDDYLFYREKVDGQKYRQKVRVRGYNTINLSDQVYIEIKQRYNQTVQKRRVKLPLTNAYQMLDPNEQIDIISGYNSKDKEVIDEILYLKYLYHLSPKVIVSYDRKAFMGYYEDDLRITFDTNLRCRSYNVRLDEQADETYFIPPQYSILEIKANHKIPIWLTSIIHRYNVQSNRVSKYCLSIDRLNLINY